MASVQSTGESVWLNATGSRIKAMVYKSRRTSPHPTLIAVLHGDLMEPGDPKTRQLPSYHYIFAGTAATRLDDVVVAALVRPGYSDHLGDQSSGVRGRQTGDNYTAEVVDTIAAAAQELKHKYAPAVFVLAGHSGGAAITADLLGRHPGAANAALLVSCPCDVPAWRRYMVRQMFKQVGPLSLVFALPVTSLSPPDLVSRIPASTRVRMVVGSNDVTAPPRFTEGYADALRKHGLDVAVTVAPGLEHNILIEPVVFDQLKIIVDGLRGSTQ
jgi:pimeloyl-ACP methyl ester carboxylesterase